MAEREGLKKFFKDGDSSKLSQEHVEKIRDILTVLDGANTLQDLDLPTFEFHRLTGDQKGRYSMKVQGGWCVTFEFEDSQPKRVDYGNYHKGKHR